MLDKLPKMTGVSELFADIQSIDLVDNFVECVNKSTEFS